MILRKDKSQKGNILMLNRLNGYFIDLGEYYVD